jgi:hypothetical protein
MSSHSPASRRLPPFKAPKFGDPWISSFIDVLKTQEVKFKLFDSAIDTPTNVETTFYGLPNPVDYHS